MPQVNHAPGNKYTEYPMDNEDDTQDSNLDEVEEQTRDHVMKEEDLEKEEGDETDDEPDRISLDDDDLEGDSIRTYAVALFRPCAFASGLVVFAA